MNTNLVKFNATDISRIDPSALPNAISTCFSSLKNVEDKVKEACSAAQRSLDQAKTASGKTINCVGWGTKDAVYALQSAVEAGAISQTRQQEVLDRILTFQQATAQGMKYLFQLGAAGLAANRAVSKAIRDRMNQLENGSPSDFDEYVMSELSSTLVELKRQEDLLLKQEKLNDVQRAMREDMRSMNDELARRVEMIEANADDIERQGKELKRQAAKDREHDAELKRQADKDREHDAELKRQADKDREHDAELKRQADKDREHDAELKRQADKDKQHDEQIGENARRVEKNRESIEANAKSIAHDARRLDQVEKRLADIYGDATRGKRSFMISLFALAAASVALILSLVVVLR